MKNLLILVTLLISGSAIAQKRPSFQKLVNLCIDRGMDRNAFDSTATNSVYFYSIAASFNRKGKVNEIFFSDDLNGQTKRLYRLDSTFLNRT